VGDLVEMRALVIRTGRTSLDISVDVYAGDPKIAGLRRTGHCVIVFVSLDAELRPAPVPQWKPVSEIDCALAAYAERLATMRKELDGEMEQRLAEIAAAREAAAS
jgi:acyl-CoA hydrolase